MQRDGVVLRTGLWCTCEELLILVRESARRSRQMQVGLTDVKSLIMCFCSHFVFASKQDENWYHGGSLNVRSSYFLVHGMLFCHFLLCDVETFVVDSYLDFDFELWCRLYANYVNGLQVFHFLFFWTYEYLLIFKKK